MSSRLPGTYTTPVPSPTFTPALKPPPGVTSNPDHPDSLTQLADIAIGVCVPLITLFFALRSLARIFIKHVWIFEDYLVAIAWAGTVAYCGVMRATMSHHGGLHGWDITPAGAHEAAYWFNVASIEYGVMIGVVKCAVLCFYRRVFSPVQGRWFDGAILLLLVLMVGFYGSTTFVKIFECSPRDKIWNNEVAGSCLQLNWILNVSGCFNTVTDYLILLLPAQAVRNLQIDRLDRVLVVLAFTFGLCAPIFATVGFVVRLRNSSNPDTTWKQPEILLWGAAELTSGLLCVCFPEFIILFRKSARRRLRPHRPSVSEMEAQRMNKRPSDPFFTKSLMSLMFSTTNGEEEGTVTSTTK